MKSRNIDASARIITVQVLLVAISTAAGFLINGADTSFALAAGGIIALLNTWLLSRSVERAFAAAQTSPTGGTLTLFSGLLVRLILMAALFGVGFVFLELSPLPFILGFVVAQVAYVFGGAGALYRPKHS